MTTARFARSACAGAASILVMLPWRPASAAESMPPGSYQVVTETVMPHLEENLRYATTRETQCLAHRELASAFPILKHPSLADCRLTEESRHEETVSYFLACEAGHGTTGGPAGAYGRGFAGQVDDQALAPQARGLAGQNGGWHFK